MSRSFRRNDNEVKMGREAKEVLANKGKGKGSKKAFNQKNKEQMRTQGQDE